MSSYDQVLRTKPHNIHHLNRYIKFIDYCKEVNQNLPDDTYTEKHHICPKAADLFPEYKSFATHPWNRVDLTARQHIMAHIMLWKAYGGSQVYAMMAMLKLSRHRGRKVPSSIEVRYLATVIEESKIQMSTTKKQMYANGYLHPWIGRKHTEETRKKISESATGRLCGENNPFYGKQHSEETRKKISESATGRVKSEETRRKHSDYMTGKRTGETHPMYGKHHTEETRQKMSLAQSGEKSHRFGKKSSEETKKKISLSKSGKNNPNFGKTGENSPRFGKHLSDETKLKMSLSRVGKIRITNGIINKTINPLDEIPDGFYRGMIRHKS